MSISKNVNADVQNENATDHIDAEQTTLAGQKLIQRMWNMIFGRDVSDCDNSEDEDDSDCYEDGYEDGYDDGYDKGYDNGHEDGHEEGYDDGYEEGEVDALELAIKDICNLLLDMEKNLLKDVEEEDGFEVFEMVSSRLEELLGTWQSNYEEKSGWVSLRKDNEEQNRGDYKIPRRLRNTKG